MPLLSFYPSDASTAEISVKIKDPKVSMTIEYYDVSALGALPRDILAFSGIPWKNVVHELPSVPPTVPDTVDTPSKSLPILRIHCEGLPDVVLSESMVIDTYLAGKAKLLGGNEWEELVIKSLYTQSYWVRYHWWHWTGVTSTPKERLEGIPSFIQGKLKTWIETIEFHHAQNARRHPEGYLLGNKISLADFMVAHVVYCFDNVTQTWAAPWPELIRKSPALTKIRQLVDSEPDLQAWRSSPEAQLLEQRTLVETEKRCGHEE